MYNSLKPKPDIWNDILVIDNDELQHIRSSPQQQIMGVHQRAREIIVRGQQAGLPIQHAFDAPLFSGQQITQGQQYDWAFMPLSEDPLYKRDGKLPIPEEVLAQLRNIRHENLDFDDLYIAHEIRKGRVKPGQKITAEMLEPPLPKESQRMSYQMGQTSRNMWRLAAIPLVIGAIAGAAAIAAAPVAAISLDPVLFGAVVGPGRRPVPGEMASFIYLAHWQYNEEEESWLA